MAPRDSPLLLKIMSRLGEVTLVEKWLPRDKKHDVYGLWEEMTDGTTTITINPIPSVVNTIIHEMLHSMYPDYSEQAIRSLTGKLCKQLSEEQEQTIYNEYKRKVGD